MGSPSFRFFFFFFNDTATTEIYTLSLHDALPISCGAAARWPWWASRARARRPRRWPDRKSTRLNSSHQIISYAVFCLKKKKKKRTKIQIGTNMSKTQYGKQWPIEQSTSTNRRRRH